MAFDSGYDDLSGLKIDRSAPRGSGDPPAWARRFILTGIAIVVLLGIVVLAYRTLTASAREVEVARPTIESSASPGIVLSAGGYIVAHHKISVNSKVTGRVVSIGVEKGDKVTQGQVLVRLEDGEFRAQVEQARGAVESAGARLRALEAGSRPQEIEQARHTMEEARANLENARVTLDRTSDLVKQGILPKQQLDDAVARHEAAQQQVSARLKAYELARIGPRREDIDRARGDLLEARGRLSYAQTLLDATEIRAPISGTILERTAEKGELVTAQFASAAEGGPRGSVVALADLTDLQVEIDISQDDFAKLGPKQRGIVTADAFPDRRYDGVIAEISPEANRQKGTVQVKVKILKPDGYLRPEMNAKVAFLPNDARGDGTKGPAGVIVPAEAVRSRDGKKIVLIAFDGRAVAREIRVSGQLSNGYRVEGLTGGETVIVKGPADLKEGDRIVVKGRQS